MPLEEAIYCVTGFFAANFCRLFTVFAFASECSWFFRFMKLAVLIEDGEIALDVVVERTKLDGPPTRLLAKSYRSKLGDIYHSAASFCLYEFPLLRWFDFSFCLRATDYLLFFCGIFCSDWASGGNLRWSILSRYLFLVPDYSDLKRGEVGYDYSS